MHIMGMPALPADSSAFILVVAAATTNMIVSFISAGAKGLCGSSNGSGHQLPPELPNLQLLKGALHDEVIMLQFNSLCAGRSAELFSIKVPHVILCCNAQKSSRRLVHITALVFNAACQSIFVCYRLTLWTSAISQARRSASMSSMLQIVDRFQQPHTSHHKEASEVAAALSNRVRVRVSHGIKVIFSMCSK